MLRYQFVMPLPIYCYDTDMGGVVYHASYLKFMDMARTEWIKAMGINPFDWHGQGLFFAAKDVRLQYLKPLTVRDKVEMVNYTEHMHRVSMEVVQIVRSVDKPDDIYFRGEITLVAVSSKGRPCRIPEELRKGFLGEI